MICEKCGAIIPDDSVVCPKCSAPVSFIPIMPEEDEFVELISPRKFRTIVVVLISILVLGFAAVIFFVSTGFIGPQSIDIWNGGKAENSKISSATAQANPSFNENSDSKEDYVTTTEEFIKETTKLIDTSEFKAAQSQDEIFIYGENNENEKIKNKITIDDKDFSLPASLSDITDADWFLADENDLVGQYGTGSFNFQNENGSNITLWFKSEKEEQEKIDKCEVVTISLGYFTENNPNFKFGSIDNDSTYEDVLSALGSPFKASFSETDKEAFLIFDNDGADNLYRLQICFDMQKNKIKTLDFYYFNNQN